MAGRLRCHRTSEFCSRHRYLCCFYVSFTADLQLNLLLLLLMMTLAPRRTQIWVFDGQNRILDKIVGRRKKRRSYEYEVSSAGLRAALAWLTLVGMIEGQEGTRPWVHERPRAGTCTMRCRWSRVWVPGQKVFAAALRFMPDADPWIVRFEPNLW